MEYENALKDLTIPAKPVIETLTGIAYDSNPTEIVQIISRHLKAVEPRYKVSSLYLIDSIVKKATVEKSSIGKEFTNGFMRTLLDIIPEIFVLLIKEDQLKIGKLIQTWKDEPKKLNPVFPFQWIEKLENTLRQKMAAATVIQNPKSILIAQMHSLIRKKEALDRNDKDIIILRKLLLHIENNPVTPQELDQIKGKINFMTQEMHKASSAVSLGGLGALHPKVVSFSRPSMPSIPQKLPIMPTIPSGLPLTNIQQIPPKVPSWPMLRPNMIDPLTLGKLASSVGISQTVRLNQTDIQKTIPDLYKRLYDRLDLCCQQCGIRFCTFPSGENDMKQHLDWHFRENKRKRDFKRVSSRQWYLSVDDWLAEKPTDVRDISNVSSIFQKPEQQEQEEIVFVLAPKDTVQCSICHEELLKVYDDDTEEFVLRGVVMEDDKYFHKDCTTTQDFEEPPAKKIKKE